MKTYDQLIAAALVRVKEEMPWDLAIRLKGRAAAVPLLIDVREPAEFNALRIPGSINVPRGILEQSTEWNYDETLPQLVTGREREIVLICRSGKRSILAADVMQQLGFTNVVSLRLGIRGWNDAELPLEDGSGRVIDADSGDVLLASRVNAEQLKPK